MRGIKSFAMVLAVSVWPAANSGILFISTPKATSKHGKAAGVELIQPPPNSKPGDRVYFEGSDYESTDSPFYFLPC